MNDASTQVHQAAAVHGFEVVGITTAEPLHEALDALRAWCEAGHAGAMGYMSRNPPERADARTLLRTVRSVVSVAVNYATPAVPFAHEERFGRVARYAWGRDYHDVVLPRLRALARDLGERLGGPVRTAVACDHSPLLERAVAARAGLGFFGKNTCLLLPRRGSWYFLGELLLDVDLPPTPARPTDHCGTCRACLTECPTEAFVSAFVLDARRCISYLTIEQRGPIPRALRSPIGAWVFGCDDCQEVCPFNRFAEPTAWPELQPAAGVGPRLDLGDLLAIDSDAIFKERFAGSPLLRARRAGLQRNAAVVARNIGAHGLVPVLEERAVRDADALVRGHALWALFGLDPARARRIAERVRVDDDPFVRAEAAAGLAEAEGA